MDKVNIAIGLLNGDCTVSLSDLVGEHLLSGCGQGFIDGSNCISFVLDNIPYSAIEDPEDGYRSCMDKIIIGCCENIEEFHPVQVEAKMDQQNDVLEFMDCHTKKIVLRVGTDYSDNYYPYFVNDWSPENLYLNQKE